MSYCTKCGGLEAPGQKFCVICGTPTSPLAGMPPPPDGAATLPYFPGEVTPTQAIPGLANFWWRVLGFILDGLFVYFLFKLPLDGLHLTHVSYVVTVVIVTFLYGSLLIGLVNGQTLGMRICRIRCVNAADQGKVTLQQAFLRAGFYCVLLALGSFYQYHTYVNPTAAEKTRTAKEALVFLSYNIPHALDLLWVAWDKKNQTLHDKFARTIVIRLAKGVR